MSLTAVPDTKPLKGTLERTLPEEWVGVAVGVVNIFEVFDVPVGVEIVLLRRIVDIQPTF